jgi:hypothetical protein
VVMIKQFQSEINSLMKQKGINSANEVLLFDSLTNLLENNFKNVKVGRLHGTSHLVQFKNSVNLSRTNANCELCDLLIVVFNKRQIRLTFHQSKYDPKIKENQFYPSSKKKAKLSKCDVEQWDLLANRPLLIKKSKNSKFNPPSHLLVNAINPSIGSYGIFYKNSLNYFDMFYSVAEDMILNQATYRSKKGRFRSNEHFCCYMANTNLNNILSNYVKSCLNIDCFLHNLVFYKIGSPLLLDGKTVDYYRLSWLKS